MWLTLSWNSPLDWSFSGVGEGLNLTPSSQSSLPNQLTGSLLAGRLVQGQGSCLPPDGEGQI